MEKDQRNFVYRNLANTASILGVLPIGLLFLDGGYAYLIPFLIFNNFMDDLDGVLARKLKIGSLLGAHLDNVCDTVVHVILILIVSAHYGWSMLLVGMIAATAIIIRLTGRLNPDEVSGNGTPTNELMRHLLFVLILTGFYEVDPKLYLGLIFIFHTVTMLVPFKFDFLIRGRAKSVTAVALVNVVLLAAWWVPSFAPFIASAFFATYLYSFALGGTQYLKGQNHS
ncbi:MAG: CDP-alcohol phosphatidyltransferase family protein [Verrucomicrobiales bacterium]|nr:CDP-alcohol phosphatidyltransferase family protein [Verrucomicrobiales bacterium]